MIKCACTFVVQTSGKVGRAGGGRVDIPKGLLRVLFVLYVFSMCFSVFVLARFVCADIARHPQPASTRQF